MTGYLKGVIEIIFAFLNSSIVYNISLEKRFLLEARSAAVVSQKGCAWMGWPWEADVFSATICESSFVGSFAVQERKNPNDS